MLLKWVTGRVYYVDLSYGLCLLLLVCCGVLDHGVAIPHKNQRSTDSDNEEFCDSMDHLAIEEVWCPTNVSISDSISLHLPSVILLGKANHLLAGA